MPSAGAIPLRLADIKSSATTYLGMDAGSYMILPTTTAINASGKNDYSPGFGDADGPGGCDLDSTASDYDRYAYKDCQHGRHFGGVNVMFTDGHAKWLKTQTIISEAQKYHATTHPPSAWDPFSD